MKHPRHIQGQAQGLKERPGQEPGVFRSRVLSPVFFSNLQYKVAIPHFPAAASTTLLHEVTPHP